VIVPFRPSIVLGIPILPGPDNRGEQSVCAGSRPVLPEHSRILRLGLVAALVLLVSSAAVAVVEIVGMNRTACTCVASACLLSKQLLVPTDLAEGADELEEATNPKGPALTAPIAVTQEADLHPESGARDFRYVRQGARLAAEVGRRGLSSGDVVGPCPFKMALSARGSSMPSRMASLAVVHVRPAKLTAGSR
jgi:hypothetical protein